MAIFYSKLSNAYPPLDRLLNSSMVMTADGQRENIS